MLSIAWSNSRDVNGPVTNGAGPHGLGECVEMEIIKYAIILLVYAGVLAIGLIVAAKVDDKE